MTKILAAITALCLLMATQNVFASITLSDIENSDDEHFNYIDTITARDTNQVEGAAYSRSAMSESDSGYSSEEEDEESNSDRSSSEDVSDDDEAEAWSFFDDYEEEDVNSLGDYYANH